MAEPSPSPPPPNSTTITDLSVDSLAHCANYLTLHDLSNFSISCKYLNGVTHSDSVWQRLFREQWPHVVRPNLSDNSGFREAYLARKAAVRQFRFADPLVADFYTEAKPFNHILLDEDDIIYSQGSCQRCLRGHNGSVSCLTDRFLGDGSSTVLASGGEDCTVRLWSLGSSGKRGQHALKATFYGHEKPIKQMSVAEHNSSLLVTISKDSKVRLWDTTTPSAVRSSCCLGMVSVPGGAPIDLKWSLIWDIRRNQETLKPQSEVELEGPDGPVTQLHADRYKIVTGGPQDRFINVWEAGTGTRTNSFVCSDHEDAEETSSGCLVMAVDRARIATATRGEGHGKTTLESLIYIRGLERRVT